MKVDEIRTALLDMGCDESKIAGLKKPELRELLDNYEEDEFEMPESVEPEAEVQETIQGHVGHKYGSKEWQEVVLDALLPGEYVEKEGKKFPRAMGLRRIVEKFMGPIKKSGPTNILHVEMPDCSRGKAIVSYEVQIDTWKMSAAMSSMLDDMDEAGLIRTYGATASSWSGNTKQGFEVFNVETAETRALGRALRMALGLKVCTAEEMSQNESEAPTTPPEAPKKALLRQVKFLESKSKLLETDGRGIDLVKFINMAEFCPNGEKYKAPQDMPYEAMKDACNMMNRFIVRGSEQLEVPQEILEVSK